VVKGDDLVCQFLLERGLSVLDFFSSSYSIRSANQSHLPHGFALLLSSAGLSSFAGERDRGLMEDGGQEN